MKKYLFILAATVTLTSCYDDYVKDNDTQAVGFANQTDVRSVIVGEGMKFSTGVALGGTIENSVDRPISFEIDYSLVSDATLPGDEDPCLLLYPESHQVAQLARGAARPRSISCCPRVAPTAAWTIRQGSHLGQIVIKNRLREIPRRRFAHAAQICDPPAPDRRQRHRPDGRQSHLGSRRAVREHALRQLLARRRGPS